MIEIKRNSGIVETMSVTEFSMWMCLMEAFHFINQKAEELNVDIDKLLKPLAIEEYIKERYESMLHDVRVEHSMGHL
jgi:hypothetical protein